MLPALPRLPDVRSLVDLKAYFVLHAPRQTGKTTAIQSFVAKLNEDRSYYALYCTVEQLKGMIDADAAMMKLAKKISTLLDHSNVEALKNLSGNAFLEELNSNNAFSSFPLTICLSSLCEKLDKDLVIFFDEVDSITDDVLLSLLTNLRTGYIERKLTPFPRSIALVGMRNIRDYRIKIRPDTQTMGSFSPFNIIKKVLTLSNFTPVEIASLYAQHSEASGQVFEEEAVQRVWYWTEGQPWLVNALAAEVVEDILRHDYTKPINASLIDQAADNLVRRRDTHIDSLLARLSEPGVLKVIESVISLSSTSVNNYKADKISGESYNNSLQYCIDLGLIKQEDMPQPANRIYASIIMRYLNQNVIVDISNDQANAWMDGNKIKMNGLLK
ncbi:MAG: AAA-like domain-containing protein [Deltaproteobacteria bacterium]|jgi:hypothetical protein|nr:AAA-like domain-containing protein [Deltaproteobacteria bacterium]